MNWRATHILTAQHDLAIMPNSVIAKTKIVNLSSPSGVHGITVTVQVAATILPATGVAILGHAILNSRLILTYPKPSIVVKAINADVITYEVTSFVADLASATPAQNDLLDLISRHLSAAHVRLAKSDGTVSSSGPEGEPAGDSERVLAQSTIFAELMPEERTALAKKLQRKLYEPGEVLLEPGVVLSSLFLRRQRRAVGNSSGGHKVGGDPAAGAGRSFRRDRAADGGRVHRPDRRTNPDRGLRAAEKMDLAPILEARPQVAHGLDRALAQRQAAGRMVSREPTANASHWFSERLQQLFNLRNK